MAVANHSFRGPNFCSGLALVPEGAFKLSSNINHIWASTWTLGWTCKVCTFIIHSQLGWIS